MNDRHSVLGAMVSNLLMLRSLLWTRPSAHRCNTAGEWASGLRALAGNTAENPPTMGSSRVTRPPVERTSRSAMSLAGLASRMIRCSCASGFLVASVTKPGSAMRCSLLGTEAGRTARTATPSVKTARDAAIVRSSFERSVAISAATVLKIPVTSRRHSVWGSPRHRSLPVGTRAAHRLECRNRPALG